MTSHIQFLDTISSSRLQEFIQGKLDKLERKFTWIINAKVIVKEENYSETDNKICEVELSVPGPNIFTKENGETHEAAISAAFEEVEILLKKHKDKMYAY